MFPSAVMTSIKSLASKPLLASSSARVLIFVSGLGADNLELDLNRVLVLGVRDTRWYLHSTHSWTRFKPSVLVPLQSKMVVIPVHLRDGVLKTQLSSASPLSCQSLHQKWLELFLNSHTHFLTASGGCDGCLHYRLDRRVVTMWGVGIASRCSGGMNSHPCKWKCRFFMKNPLGENPYCDFFYLRYISCSH